MLSQEDNVSHCVLLFLFRHRVLFVAYQYFRNPRLSTGYTLYLSLPKSSLPERSDGPQERPTCHGEQRRNPN
jgi:hypothetical protein